MKAPMSVPGPAPLALITGGGGAIAGEIATRLHARGYRLVLVDVDQTRLQGAADALRGGGAQVTTEVADLSDLSAIHALSSRIEADYADLALLVNTAGMIVPGDIDTVSQEVLDTHVHVNLLAAMHLTRAAARVMRPRRKGDIVSIVSMGGIIATPTAAAYNAAKFGLRGFQTAVRSELAAYGIRVMGVFPSGVDTPMLRYEATHGGSAMNFFGKVYTAADVAEATMTALETGRLETYVPYGDSLSSRLIGAAPWLLHPLMPVLTKVGERGRRKFIAERGLTPGDGPLP